MDKIIHVGSKTISPKNKAFLIAEIGLNHNHNLETAYAMIDKAQECGADAVKFQFYITENMLLTSSPAFDIFKNLELSESEIASIKTYCDKKNIIFFASPFCFSTANFLDSIGVPAFKIASMDTNYYKFIEHIAMKRKPVFISTGMSSLGEIEKAVNSIYKMGNDSIVILHCISKYPTSPEEMNLNMITKLRSMFPQFIIGLSDHCLDNTMSIAARVLGAQVFERHFTLDRAMEGPDQSISLDSEGFADLRKRLDQVDEGFLITDERKDLEIAQHARRSLFAKNDINKGDIITTEMINIVRPGTGIAPEFIGLFVNRKASRFIKKDQPFSIDDI